MGWDLPEVWDEGGLGNTSSLSFLLLFLLNPLKDPNIPPFPLLAVLLFLPSFSGLPEELVVTVALVVVLVLGMVSPGLTPDMDRFNSFIKSWRLVITDPSPPPFTFTPLPTDTVLGLPLPLPLNDPLPLGGGIPLPAGDGGACVEVSFPGLLDLLLFKGLANPPCTPLLGSSGDNPLAVLSPCIIPGLGNVLVGGVEEEGAEDRKEGLLDPVLEAGIIIDIGLDLGAKAFPLSALGANGFPASDFGAKVVVSFTDGASTVEVGGLREGLGLA